MSDDLAYEDTISDLLSGGDVLDDKYRVEHVIGAGGMAIVVAAHHLVFDEPVAIKFLLPQMGADEEALARFEREARAAFKIKSEHVARVIDVGKRDGVPYMVMEYLDGSDLADLLSRRRSLSVEEAVDLVLQTCEAVAEAHTLGILHRDLKPENLFLTQRSDGTRCIKVLDFGLSKIRAGGRRERTLTQTSQPMGTPAYMSPEQWVSSSDVDVATDIWAFGVLLYELVTGVAPFEGETLGVICGSILQREPEPMRKHAPQVPEAFERAVMRCLRKRASERFGNVAELAVAIEPFGPRRSGTIVERIVGIFRRAGVEVATGSPSSEPSTPRRDRTDPPATEHPMVPRGHAVGAIAPEEPEASTVLRGSGNPGPHRRGSAAEPPEMTERSITAQSWLSSMRMERASSRRSLAAIAGIVVAAAAIGVVAFVHRDEGTADRGAASPAAVGEPAATAAARTEPTSAASSGAASAPAETTEPVEPSPATTTNPEPVPEPTASASAAPSGEEEDPPAPVPRWRPPPKPDPEPEPAPEPEPDIFEHR